MKEIHHQEKTKVVTKIQTTTRPDEKVETLEIKEVRTGCHRSQIELDITSSL